MSASASPLRATGQEGPEQEGPEQEGPEQRARSCGAFAARYDSYRASPPPAAVDWVLPDGAAAVLDLGAGTGAMTRVLLERVPGSVVAVEPDERMLAVLAHRSPAALDVGSIAELLPFVDASFDAVVVASAWHWMDPASAVDEIGRVLRPAGCFGVLWNSPARRIGWVAELTEVRHGVDEGGAREVGGHSDRHRLELPEGAPFSPPENAVFSWSKTFTLDDLVGLAGTYSAVITLPARERSAVLDGFRSQLESNEVFRQSSAVELPMECRCWRTRRKAEGWG